jgi:transcription elongation factor GreA
MTERYPITAGGFAAMEVELKELKFTKRPDITKKVAEAREHGDLSENAEYHAAREQQSFNEARITELEAQVGLAQVIDISELSGNTVKFGATIKLVDDDDKELTLKIVGAYEADAAKNKISFSSPLARALMGKPIGDYIEVQLPKGEQGYEILEVAFI